jgi:Membrane proteins related to metalloendopeptidases
MKRAFTFFLLYLFLFSCAPVQTPQTLSTPIPTSVALQPTFTSIPPSATSTPETPTQTSTATPGVCDPRLVDYCITDGHFLFQRPIKLPGNTSVDVTYPYASTANGTRDPHHGVEFLNKFGTPVYATGDGVILFAGPDTRATYSRWLNYYGNVIVIQHAEDLYTLYAHLSRIMVEAGQSILAGDQIGEVGQTGVAIGSHLHFEVRRGDVENYYSTQNPELWLVPNLDKNGLSLGALQISALNHEGGLAKRAEFTLQRFDAQDQPASNVYYGVTYSADMLAGDENAAIGDLSPGKYRMVLQYNGQRFERWVEVESGKLTQVVFMAG